MFEYEDERKVFLVEKFGPGNNPTYRYRWGDKSRIVITDPEWVELAQETADGLSFKELDDEVITADALKELDPEEQEDFLNEHLGLLHKSVLADFGINTSISTHTGYETIADYLAENQ